MVAAIAGLGPIADTGGIVAIRGLMEKDGNRAMRNACVTALAVAGDRDLSRRLKGLENVDEDVVEEALVRLGESGAIRRLTDRFRVMEYRDPNTWDTPYPRASLVNVGTLSQAQRSELIEIAMKILRMYPPDDLSKGELVSAVDVLGRLRAVEAVSEIERLARMKVLPPWDMADTDALFVEAALEALGAIGQDSSAKVVASRLNEFCGWHSLPIRLTAVRELCRIKGPAATRFLVEALDHEDFLVAAYAARELGVRKATAAREKLAALSESRVPLLRRVAKESLARITGS